ncbi:MAG: copper-translocating P-type ATPase [Verrucomicrobia bacterium]|nr:MAG: copper-translocating P-type ATPase [Verrucomicrobiota bacterium]
MEKAIEFLSGVRMTVVGGLFLAASLAFIVADKALAVDPAWVAVAVCGLPLAYAAVFNLIEQRRITVPLLVTIAMASAIYIGEIFAAGEIAFLMAVGQILEEKSVERARRGIKNLISLAPTRGRLITGGGEKSVPVMEIRESDILRVLPGETVPADGVVVSGASSIDQSVITGESLPVDKAVGDEVFCGTINRFGAIDIKATRAGRDSSFEKLIRLVRQAERDKSPTQRIAAKWASWLIPAALLLALIVYFATGDMSRAVTILVVFCPCSLVLATPTSIMAAIGQAAKYGVIVKSGAALETMGKADCVAFDKTGTLTLGKPVVSDAVSASALLSDSDMLALAASAESLSEHPLGKAVAACAAERGLKLSTASDFKMVPGRGISASVDGRRVLCGNARFLSENSVEAGLAEKLQTFRKEGKAVILVAVDGEFAGVVALSDVIRDGAAEAVRQLSQMGAKSVLLTGDNAGAAEFLAEKTGVGEVFAGLLPSEKMSEIKRMRDGGLTVCMVGDGVNDAPALKSANVGVAMASMGSDIAVEAADIALMGDDISKIPYLKRLSNAAVWLIKFNIILSIFINAAAITLSILGVLNPVTGALVHNVGSLIVVVNAGLLYDRNYLTAKKSAE